MKDKILQCKDRYEEEIFGVTSKEAQHAIREKWHIRLLKLSRKCYEFWMIPEEISQFGEMIVFGAHSVSDAFNYAREWAIKDNRPWLLYHGESQLCRVNPPRKYVYPVYTHEELIRMGIKKME